MTSTKTKYKNLAAFSCICDCCSTLKEEYVHAASSARGICCQTPWTWQVRTPWWQPGSARADWRLLSSPSTTTLHPIRKDAQLRNGLQELISDYRKNISNRHSSYGFQAPILLIILLSFFVMPDSITLVSIGVFRFSA